ncbi:unnamed protein product [Arabidopsis lyrata]|uniref:uncharacterized protein LOC9317768 n=1 Tax=Arabidopsis lyrata subsp. lyrata TaxID=81972 RepID=UPI000A29E871|nr:uncharacterized protein LOC9317768 [Arabidopsis lyrata subsp. lyrata]CAH8265402.1 unnamed protein product [Arabidopsis lyrata]|eukprot:XP_020884467.1 uncharacterized protein LOC9317768 [Arabidopsis lyrata subsp. lyrata]
MSLCFSEEELDIDDIDIDDHHHSQQQEKPKEQGILSRLSKQKMVNRFSNFKGKLKKMATKNEKSVVTNEKSMRRKTVPQSIRSRRNTGLTRPRKWELPKWLRANFKTTGKS